MPFIHTEHQHFPQHQHGSQFLYIYLYIYIYIYKGKICFIYHAEPQTRRVFKRKNFFVLIYEKSQVIQIAPLGIFLMKWNHMEIELPPCVPWLSCGCFYNWGTAAREPELKDLLQEGSAE